MQIEKLQINDRVHFKIYLEKFLFQLFIIYLPVEVAIILKSSF